MKILINFHDNDFCMVLKAFGDLVAGDSEQYAEGYLTKERIVAWFNAIAPTLYEMVQHQGRSYTPVKKEYLQITTSQVHLNEEVDKKMDTWSQWGNGEAVLINFSKPIATVTIV